MRSAALCPPPPRTARALWQGTDALIDVSVKSVEDEVASDFIAVLEEHGERLRRRYGLATIIGEEPRWGSLENARSFPSDRWHELEWVHCDKMTWELVQALTDRVPAGTYDFSWLGMHPDLAAVYLCALADLLARRNAMAAITDEPGLHTALNGWGTGTLAHVLLDQLYAQ